ncbi:MAG TPA: reverse transcriptase domain-containing protein [Patescibacteria group bacterium]|nr:reverse transcriptase domain-containing protein [Patescibacteria group bacterium]
MLIHSDFEQLVSVENLLVCWDRFKKSKRSKSDVMEFERHLEDNIFILHDELLSLKYRHGYYSTFNIYDPKHRVISKANVCDRLVHHLVFQELYRVFEPTFIHHSYSSRIGKGTHLAVTNVSRCLRATSRNYTKTVYALKCDIKKFFWSVSHPKLLAIIKQRISDERFLALTQELIESFPRFTDVQSEREREREREREYFLSPPKQAFLSATSHRKFLPTYI